MAYLQSQKKQDLVDGYVAKLTKGNPVEVYFTKPKMQVQVDAGKAPYFGKEGAPITVVEFSDFQCPYCSKAVEKINAVLKAYPNDVKLIFKQFPLDSHPQAQISAQAALYCLR